MRNDNLGGQYIPGNNMPINEALKQLGIMMQTKRLDMNITQEDLASHAGISEGTLKRLEAGKPVSTENMIKLMMGMGMVKDLLKLYEQPEMSLKERFELQQKKQSSKRKRASR